MKNKKKPEEISLETTDNMDLPERKGKKTFVVIVLMVFLVFTTGVGVYIWQQNELKKQTQQLQQEINELKNKSEGGTDTQKTQETSKSYVAEYEGLSFTYPSEFALSDTSRQGDNDQPSSDHITLTNGNFIISMQTGAWGLGGACEKCKVLLSEPVTILGKQLYINYVSTDGGPKADYLIVSKTQQDTFGGFEGKNIKGPTGGDTIILINASYKDGDENISKTLDQLKQDPNIQSLKEFLQSLQY